MADEVTAGICDCSVCKNYRSNFKPGDEEKFNFSSVKFNCKFPKSEDLNHQPINYDALISILEKRGLPETEHLQNLVALVRFITYVDIEKVPISMQNLILLCEHIYGLDLESLIKDEKFAYDFLCAIARLFVVAWHTFQVVEDGSAEWAARQLRKFLVYISAFPIIAKQVIPVFFTAKNWPEVGPLQIIEILCKHSIYCLETVALLVNLTRIEKVCENLDKGSKCVEIIKFQFTGICRSIKVNNELGRLHLMLFMNLAVMEDFSLFLTTEHDGYIMTVVIVDLISKPCLEPYFNSVWIFLRNLSLFGNGRETILRNLELYLGQLLLPIAGPEPLTPEEILEVPAEVSSLGPEKLRVKDRMIKSCILDILYSLCRYRKDRVLLRNTGIYVVLKYYHLAEDDPELTEKIENLVNILIRKEESEIEVDDILEGLAISDHLQDPLSIKYFVKHLFVARRERVDLATNSTSPKLNFRAKMRFFPEDDESFKADLNPCTSEILSQEESLFDYSRFSELNRLRVLINKANRLQEISNVSVVDAPETQSKGPSNEFLQRQFIKTYGDTDFNSPLMLKRLATMKATILEMNEVDVKEVNNQLVDLDIPITSDWREQKCSKAIEHKISSIFTSEEIYRYGFLDPSRSDGDWFMIPRPPLSEIREKYFPHLKLDKKRKPKSLKANKSKKPKSWYTKSDDRLSNKRSKAPTIEKTPDVQKNKLFLHLYDPMVHFGFNVPYRIYKKRPYDHTAKQLAVRILEHLNRFPFGVTPSVFWEKFYNEHGYVPNRTDLDNLAKEILFDRDPKTQIIMFPCMFRGVINFRSLLFRLWHAIKCLLSTKGYYIATDTIFSLVKARYGLQFDPLNWGFSSVNSFIMFLVEGFEYKNDLIIHRIIYSENHEVKYKDYLIVDSSTVKGQLADVHGLGSKLVKVEEAHRRHKRRIPRGYLSEHSTILYHSDSMTAGTTILADLKAIHNPERLSVIPETDYNQTWDFHESLQVYPLVERFACQKPLDPNRLKFGMYVMAYLKWGHYGPKWFRVRILSEEDNNDKYLVYGIDFGFLEYLTAKDMRYMPWVEVGEEIAHAIPVKLQNVTHPSGCKNICWDHDAVNKVFARYSKDDDILKVTLVTGEFDLAMGCKRWAIQCDVVNRDSFEVLAERIHIRFVEDFLEETRNYNVAEKLTMKVDKIAEENQIENEENEGEKIAEESRTSGVR